MITKRKTRECNQKEKEKMGKGGNIRGGQKLLKKGGKKQDRSRERKENYAHNYDMDNERVKSEGEIKHGGEKINIESREENVC